MLRENINILQIMITRATKVLNDKGATSEHVNQTGENFSRSDKISAPLQALRILNHEHRQTINTYTRIITTFGLHTHVQA